MSLDKLNCRGMSGKVVLVTGSTDGVGRIVAERLAEMGAVVLVHGRSAEKVERVACEIREASGSKSIEGYVADFGILAEVSALADEVLEKHSRLDVLINNAGAGPGAPSEQGRQILTADGHELRFQVNYLATVLLCQKLLPAIKSAGGRIINVGSEAQAPLDLSDLINTAGFEAYARSKLAVIMFSFWFAEKVSESGVSVNALDPGSFLNTRMVREAFGVPPRDPEIGVRAHLYLACDAELESVTGEYYIEGRLGRAHGAAYDTATQDELARITDELTSEYY